MKTVNDNFYPALYMIQFLGTNIASTMTWRTHKEQLVTQLSTPCYVIGSINPHISCNADYDLLFPCSFYYDLWFNISEEFF